MSIINVLYNNYCNEERRSTAKEAAMRILEEMLPHREYDEVESYLNIAEDESDRDAFEAGVKAAMHFLSEVTA